ncbi:MAG: acylphosphatase [Bradymonadaceae bacterium]
MSDQARAHLRIYGRVQGVFFRANTRKQSQRRGLTGWVENLADGSVEAIIEGPREKVEEVVEWAKQGPPRANVEDLNVDWEEPKASFRRSR